MKFTILSTAMTLDEADGYHGKVHFAVEGHKAAYEITLVSKKGKEWMYSLNYLEGAGKEEEMVAVEEWLEEDDDSFDQLIEAVMSAVE